MTLRFRILSLLIITGQLLSLMASQPDSDKGVSFSFRVQKNTNPNSQVIECFLNAVHTEFEESEDNDGDEPSTHITGTYSLYSIKSSECIMLRNMEFLIARGELFLLFGKLLI